MSWSDTGSACCELVGDRGVRLVVLAEVAVQEVAEPGEVLLEERLVEAVVLDGTAASACSCRGEHRVGDVTREEPEEANANSVDSTTHQHELEQPARDRSACSEPPNDRIPGCALSGSTRRPRVFWSTS